jgi:putative Mg2+ transporter-C (MgtC) family protein
METFDQFLSFAPGVFLRLLVALFCGGAIGMERERRGKPAGLRTNILICVGSMLYTLMSLYIGGYAGVGNVSNPALHFDVARIAAQIVVGIGFIGAGAIMRERGSVVGLTTAAMVWVVGAIGILAGAGYIYMALATTIFIVCALVILEHLEQRMLGKCEYGMLRAIFHDDDFTRRGVANILTEHEIPPAAYTLTKINGTVALEMRYCIKHPAHHKFLHAFHELPGFVELKTV